MQQDEEVTPYTDPLSTGWRVGNESDFICFDFCVMQHQVYIHSFLVMSSEQRDEDFLYELHDREDAIHAAQTMVEDAAEYLYELDVELLWTECRSFIEELMLELKESVH